MSWHLVMTVSVTLCLALAGLARPAASQSPGSGNDEPASLQEERIRLWREFRAAGGQRAVDEIGYRMTTREWQIARIEERLGELAGSTDALEEMRARVDDQSVFGLADLAEESGEEAVEHGARKVLEGAGKKGAGKALGWIGLVGDVVEYGGKKIIKELNVDQLEELVRQNRINLSEALKLQSALLRDNNDDRRLRARLLEMKKRYQAATLRLQEARLRARKKTREPEEIVDFCSYVPDRKARKACYGAWSKQCSGISQRKHEQRCYAVFAAAGAGGSTGGKIWNVCAHMRPDYKAICYKFGSVVRKLCQMIPDGKERAECIRNVRRIPPQGVAGN